MLYTSLTSSWPRVIPLHLVPKIESAFEVDYIFEEWCMFACLGYLCCSRIHGFASVGACMCD